MKLWLVLFAAFIIQEPISSGALILQAYQQHYNPWIMHVLFITATMIDIVLGYYVGSYIHRKFSNQKLITYIRTKLEQFLAFIGKRGKVIGLIIFAPMIFPVSALFIPWIGVPLWEAAIYVLIGEVVIWYGSEWLLVLTTKAFVADSKAALLTLISVLVLVSLIVKIFVLRRKNLAK